MSDNLSKSIFDEDIVIDDFIRDDFMGEIFSNISDILDDKYVSSFEIPVATHMAMLKIQKMIDLALIDHDGEYSPTEPLEVLRPDAEPIPSIIDSWARGTVKIKKISTEDKIPHLPNESNNSISSGYTSTKGDRSSKGGTSRMGMRSRGATSGRPLTDDDTGKIIDSDDPDGEFANLSLTATAHMFDLLQKKKRQIDLGYVEKDTEKGEFTLMQEQMEKASKELKGKKFTLDRYGKPVVIGVVNPEKLVPFSTKIVPSIKSVEAGEQNDIANATIATTSSSNAPITSKNVRSNSLTSNGTQQSLDVKSKDKKKQFVRVAGSRAVDESSFKPTLSLAVTLSGVEQIPKLNPGVSLRSNTTVRMGDRLPEDPKHISRKQYESQTLSRRSIGLNDNSTIESLNRNLESSSFYTNTEQSSKLNGSLHLSTNKSHGNKVTSLKSLDSLPDIDSLEGSHVIEPSDGHLYQELSDEELGLGPIKAVGGSPVNSRLPGKPTPQQVLNSQLITGSPENGRPRDRDLPKNMISVSERRHLPAPSMGQITGHGMPIEKFQDRKNYIDSSPNDKWTQGWRNA